MKLNFAIPMLLCLFACSKSTDETPLPTPSSLGTPVAFSLSNAGQAYGKGVCVDKQDNFYYTSLFQGTLSGKSIAATGGVDNYFAKHDKNGALLWERSFGGVVGGITVAHGIDTDDAGNVYLAGYFGAETATDGRTASFGGGKTATSRSGYDAFVAKYDASGTAQWAFGLGNTAGVTEERAWDLVAEPGGNFYVSGAFSGTVNFNPLGSAARSLSVPGIGHFLAKYNAEGQNLWAVRVEANVTNVFNEGYTTVDFDANGTVFLAGVYRNSVTIGTTTLTSAGQADIFLARYAATDGSAQTVKSFGGPGQDVVSPGAMRVSKSGEPHLTGRFAGTANFGGTSLSSQSPGNVFLLACTPAGATKWAISMSSATGLDGGHRVDFDPQGNVFVAGWFRGTTNFNGRGTAPLTANGTADAGDVFLAKYSATGDYLWAKSIGAVVSGADNLAICAGLAADSQGNTVITGKFYGQNADFDPAPERQVLLSSGGQDDCFLAKYTGLGELFRK
ncbi:MAG: hypothetical protein H7Y12_09305 [Sphingobacteriaceae bacterium]|nr:hypothetical protein [Cytophagaceae bacterium]